MHKGEKEKGMGEELQVQNSQGRARDKRSQALTEHTVLTAGRLRSEESLGARATVQGVERVRTNKASDGGTTWYLRLFREISELHF